MSNIKSPRKSKEVSDLESIISKYPARHKQISQLHSLMGKPDQLAYPCIFIYGLSATGKSTIVKTLLCDLNLPHAWINCIEAYSQRLLMESILNQISGVMPGPHNDFEGYDTCLNMCDFIRLLKKAIVEKDLTEETVYIVLDNAERLRNMPPAVLAALLRLQDIMHQNLCVILISEIIWEKFRNGVCFYEPYQVSFLEYTKDETISILEKDCPEKCSKDFYRHYLNLVMSVFHMVSRNLLELRHISLSNFPKYFEPIENGEATEKDVRKLWRNIEPYLKKSLNTVYLRETSLYDNTLNRSQKQKPAYDIRANVELPFFSKFLLIAAYIASYNPPASDKKFFLKNTGKTYKRKSGHKKTAPANQHQKGPKAFPLSRLLSIFYVIVEEKVSPSVALMSQVSNLVTLRLLEVKVGNDHPLTAAKYKCLVNLDFITSVASTVRFDIGGYLFDFV